MDQPPCANTRSTSVPAQSTATPKAQDERTGAAQLKRQLRTMSYEEGERALAPVQLNSSGQAPAPPTATTEDATGPASTRDPATLNAARLGALEQDLKTEYEDNRRVAMQLWPAVDAIDEKLKTATGDQKTELEATRKDLSKQLAAADAKVAAAQKDLALLAKGPEVTPTQLNDMLARRETTVAQPASSDAHSATTIGDKGVTKSTTTVANEMTEGGASQTKTDASKTEIGLTGGSRTTSKQTAAVTGDTTRTTGTSSTKAVDLTKGTYSSSTTDATTTKDAQGVSGVSNTKALEVGPGGITSSASTTTTKGEDKTTNASSTGLTRGDGKLGGTTTNSTATEKGDGSGSSSSTTTNGGLIAGKDGVGVYGGGETKATKKYANGLSVTGKAAAGGKCVYNIEPIADTDPQLFQIKGGITLEGSLGGGVGGEKGKDAKVSGSLGASASATVVMSFGSRLDEAGALAWKAQLAQAEGGVGGGAREFQIISTGMSQNWSAARDLYDRMQGGKGVTESLKDGESVGLSVDGKAGVNGDMSAKSGQGSFGAGGGYEKGQKIEGEVSRSGDATTTDIKVTDRDALSGNVKGGMGVASMSIGGKQTSSQGTGYKFKIPDSHPNAAALRKEAEGLRTQAELAAFAKAHPEVVGAKTTTEGEGRDMTTGVGVGPANIALTSGGSTNAEHTEQYDEQGNVKAKTDKHTGESHLGGTFGIGPLTMGSNSQEQVAATVKSERGADGKMKQTAAADVSDTDTEKGLDLHGTLENVSNIGDKPLGALTGSTPIVASKEKKEVAGFFLDDDDFNRIIASAKDPKRWNKAFSRVANMDDWEACRKAVVAAGGDKELVAAALAKWSGGGEHGRNTNLEELLDVHSGGGGDRYEFPDGVGHLKPLFLKLVVNNPMGAVDKLVGENKLAEAGEAAQKLADQVASLENQFTPKGGEYKNANVHLEMASRIGKRQRELALRARELSAKASGKELTPDMLEKEKAASEFNRLMALCKKGVANEARLFAAINANHTGLMGNHSEPENVKMVNELRANVKLWEPQYQQMIQLADTHGFTGGGANFRDWKPDKVKLRFAYDGKNPLSDEASTAQHDSDMEDRRSNEANESAGKMLRESLTSTAGMTRRADGSYFRELTKAEQAAADKQDYARLRPVYDANYAKQQGLVAAARAAATQAKGRCNLLTSGGNWDKVSKAAFAPYNQGYAQFSAAEKSWQAAVLALKSTDLKGLQLYWYPAQAAPGKFNEAAASFKQGDSLQGPAQ